MLTIILLAITVVAALGIFAAALKLHEAHHAGLHRPGRMLLLLLAFGALYTAIEALAWSKPMPLGATLFLALNAFMWVGRAFCPVTFTSVIPAGLGLTGAAAVEKARAAGRAPPNRPAPT